MSAIKTKSSANMQFSMYTKTPFVVIAAATLLVFSAHAQIPANPLETSTQAPKPVAAPAPAPAMPQAVVAPQQAPAAKAQTPAPMAYEQSQNSPAAMEIQRINENMTVLQAQLNQLELQVKVAGKKRDLSGLNGDAAQSSFNSKKGNPSVVSVAGLKGQLEAVLVFPGSSTQRVKEGDIIDDRRVVKVSANEVILSDLKGKNIQRLTFGTSAVIRENPSMQNFGGMPMPAMR